MSVVAPAFLAPAAVRRGGPVLTAIAASLLLGACAGGSSNPLTDQALAPSATLASADANAPQSELQKATAYWGKQYSERPADPRAAVNYALNLKATGAKRDALTVLQTAHQSNPNDRQLNSEYGRLALEFDQLTLAQKLLEQADDPAKPDWRVVSARGTVLAKQGRHSEAVSYFERAREIAPDQPSVLNNLAMAHALGGQAGKAETLLRQAAQSSNADPRVQQNLALVLGLQGKHDEAKVTGADQGSVATSLQNADLVRDLVQANDPDAPAALASARETAPKPSATRQSKANGAKLSTASVEAAPAKIKGKGKPVEAEVDAAELVRRLADGQGAPGSR